MALALPPLFEARGSPDFQTALSTLSRMEIPLWRLVDERPAHLLSPRFTSWTELLESAVDSTLASIDLERSLSTYTWGERNRLRIRHPLSGALPAFARWLNLPADPIPGDLHMPRVSAPGFAASERLVVAPGHEEEGILHLPGGQSGHPLSAHYRDQYEAWLRGESLPLLPGPVKHVLELRPRSD